MLEIVSSLVTIIGGPIAAYLAIVQLIQIKKELSRRPKILVGFRKNGSAGIELDKEISIKRDNKSEYTSITYVIENIGDKTAREIMWNTFVPLPIRIAHGQLYSTSWERQVYPLNSNKANLNPGEEQPIEVKVILPKSFPNFKLHVRVTGNDLLSEDHFLWINPAK